MPFVSPPVTRLVASEEKATSRPLALREGKLLKSSPPAPPGAALIRVVVFVFRSRTNTSLPLSSPATRLSAVEAKAMMLPSPLMNGRVLGPSAGSPFNPTLTSVVVPVWRS